MPTQQRSKALAHDADVLLVYYYVTPTVEHVRMIS
jgi:hypothetical protein